MNSYVTYTVYPSYTSTGTTGVTWTDIPSPPKPEAPETPADKRRRGASETRRRKKGTSYAGMTLLVESGDNGKPEWPDGEYFCYLESEGSVWCVPLSKRQLSIARFKLDRRTKG